jgi:hypothetical protein
MVEGALLERARIIKWDKEFCELVGAVASQSGAEAFIAF